MEQLQLPQYLCLENDRSRRMLIPTDRPGVLTRGDQSTDGCVFLRTWCCRIFFYFFFETA